MLILSAVTTGAQNRYDIGYVAGGAVSIGDVAGTSFFKTKFSNKNALGFPRYTLGGYCRYKISRHLSVKGNLLFVKLSGSDSNSPNALIAGRNLHFSTGIIEASLTGEWNFIQITRLPGWSLAKRQRRKRWDGRAYLTAGMGLFYYQPMAQYGGKTYNLRGYATEGVKYFPVSVCFPVGLGFSYAVNNFRKVSLEITYRFTTTDYIDDVSNRYAEKPQGSLGELLSNPNHALATDATTSNGSTVASSSNYGWDRTRALGMFRGNPKKNDGYAMVTLSYGMIIKGFNSHYRERFKSLKTRKRMARRRTRAKF